MQPDEFLCLNYRLVKVDRILPVFEPLKFGQIGKFFKVYISVLSGKKSA